jgi:hypothetical protein
VNSLIETVFLEGGEWNLACSRGLGSLHIYASYMFVGREPVDGLFLRMDGYSFGEFFFGGGRNGCII